MRPKISLELSQIRLNNVFVNSLKENTSKCGTVILEYITPSNIYSQLSSTMQNSFPTKSESYYVIAIYSITSIFISRFTFSDFNRIAHFIISCCVIRVSRNNPLTTTRFFLQHPPSLRVQANLLPSILSKPLLSSHPFSLARFKRFCCSKTMPIITVTINKHSTIQTTIPLSTYTQRIASLAPSYKSHFPSAHNFFPSFPSPFAYRVSIDSLANPRGSALPSIPTSSGAQRHTPMKLPFK